MIFSWKFHIIQKALVITFPHFFASTSFFFFVFLTKVSPTDGQTNRRSDGQTRFSSDSRMHLKMYRGLRLWNKGNFVVIHFDPVAWNENQIKRSSWKYINFFICSFMHSFVHSLIKWFILSFHLMIMIKLQ